MRALSEPSSQGPSGGDPDPLDGRRLVIPDYSGPCTSGVVPALLDDPDNVPSWMPSELAGVRQVVVLVIDGLGWNQLQAHRRSAPNLTSLAGGPITTVAPTTTATALTSIATGAPPGEHGVMGYRVAIDREVLNVLRWTTPRGDARNRMPPYELAPVDPFLSQRPPVVSRAEFAGSGFTGAHLRGVRYVGYRMASTLSVEVVRLLNEGEPFVYAYHDGLDKVGHEYGVAEHYEAELFAIDYLVEHLISRLPRDAALVVTADHGMIEVGDNVVVPAPEVLSMVDFQSGEGRFRWLHAVPGAVNELAGLCRELYSDRAWVVTADDAISDGWFGPVVTQESRSRIGDVALVPFEPIAFDDPADTGPYILVGRHGSMTADEVLVPLLAHRR